MPFECIINLIIYHFIMFIYLYGISTWTIKVDLSPRLFSFPEAVPSWNFP